MKVPDASIRALRLSTAWARMDHVSCIRLGGAHAYEVLDRICPAELFLRDLQIRAIVLLREDASVAADAYVCRDDQEFIIMAEGMTGAELIEYVNSAAPPGLDLTVRDLRQDHQLLSVHGPYAWELLGELLGADIIGLPYLSFMHLAQGICFRAGKTGEFGYDLLLPEIAAARLALQLEERSAEFDTREVGLDALDQCALENWFFNIRREGRFQLSPLELQLQWRVSYGKSYPGSGALVARRQAGAQRRVTTIVSEHPLSTGDSVVNGETVIGRIINAGYSATRGDHVALALLDRRWAASGIDHFAALGTAGRLPVRTVSPPVINNRSLYVSPQLHNFRTREQNVFPELVPKSARYA